MCICYTPVALQFKRLLLMTFSITVFQHWVNVEYGVLDHGLCVMECTCVSPHHIYSYWHFNTSACCNVGKRISPTRPHQLLHISVTVSFGSYTAESRSTIYDWCSSRKMTSRILPRPPPVCTLVVVYLSNVNLIVLL